MKQLLERLNTIWHQLDRSIYVGDRYRSNIMALTLVSLVSTALGVALTVLNIIEHDAIMTAASFVTVVMSVACAVFAGVMKRRDLAIIIPTGFCMIAITIYVFTGAGDGVAMLWTLLVPLGISYFVNVKTGIYYSVYFTILMCIIFYTPLRERYSLYYNEEFMQRFPMLYAALSVFTCMAMVQYHRTVLFEIDHTKELTEEVERQTAVAEDLMEVMDSYVSAAIDKTDRISGIMSRSAGEMVITQAMMASDGCFVFFDVDNLKKINDNHGHEAGDRILHIMGDTLKQNSRERLCCRLGGDEFLMFIKDVTKAEAVQRVEKVMRDFNDNKKDDVEVAIASLSAGMVMTLAGDSYPDAYNKADKALYYVKMNGKSGYDFYKTEYDSVGNVSVDIDRLVDGIKTSGSYTGAMSIDYRNFTKIYEYIENIRNRFDHPFRMIVITLELPAGKNPGIEELERAMYAMERSISRAIRDVDVLTRYSNRQFLVILMGSHPEGVRTAVDRIFEDYRTSYGSELFVPSYTVAETEN